MYDGAACGVARIPAGKPVEGKEKATGESLLSTVALICLRGVHQSYSVPVSTGARCLFLQNTMFAGWGRGVEHPSLGAWGRRTPTTLL